MVRRIICSAWAVVFLFMGPTLLLAQDLSVALVDSPKIVKAGQDLAAAMRLEVANIGKKGKEKIALELVLKKNPVCPDRPAAYSPKYYDGVLLRQGREYLSLAPGKSVTIVPLGANTIPLDTPVGRTYYLCAALDEGNGPRETDDKNRAVENSCDCRPIKIVAAEEGPVVTGFVERCLVPRDSLTILGRNFGPVTGTVTALTDTGMPMNLSVSSWRDSMIVVGIPDDSRMREGAQYTIQVRSSGGAERVAASGNNIGICHEQEKPPVSGPRPMPPFFPEQQPFFE